MTNFPFRPIVEQLGSLSAAVAPISDIQQQLRANGAAHLAVNDRVAHQYQIAGGKVLLRIESQLPKSLLGVGLFQADREFTGIAWISTGLGCPHNENLPDFLSIRLAFRTPTGRRVDFLGINHPASPTPRWFVFCGRARWAACGYRRICCPRSRPSRRKSPRAARRSRGSHSSRTSCCASLQRVRSVASGMMADRQSNRRSGPLRCRLYPL